MLILKSFTRNIVAITCCLLILAPSSAKATALKDAFDIVVTLLELFIKAQNDENERKADQERRRQQQPEGVIHVYSAWGGIIEPRYIPQPDLESAKHKYIKVPLLIQNRCNRPVYIEPHLFWMTKHFVREPYEGLGRIFRVQMNRWAYEEYDFGKDVLPYGWISPGENVKGYIFSRFSDFEPEFQWNLTYYFTESGDNFFKDDASCTIIFH